MTKSVSKFWLKNEYVWIRRYTLLFNFPKECLSKSTLNSPELITTIDQIFSRKNKFTSMKIEPMFPVYNIPHEVNHSSRDSVTSSEKEKTIFWKWKYKNFKNLKRAAQCSACFLYERCWVHHLKKKKCFIRSDSSSHEHNYLFKITEPL